MVTVIIFLIVLAVLIFVHELGHFLAARAFGIRIDAFKIGFGPKLFAWKRGETEYGVNLIPFGGYVKIFGEDPNDESITGPEKDRSFVHKAKWKQIIVLFSGILFNFLFAYLIITFAFATGVPSSIDSYPEYANRMTDSHIAITDVDAGSPAEKAGLKAGDTILGYSSIEAVEAAIAASQGNGIDIHYERGTTEGDAKVVAIQGIVQGKYAIGIALDDVATLKLPIYLSFYEAGRFTIYLMQEIAVGLWTLVAGIFTGTSHLSDVTGPVGIAGLVGDAARLGFTYLLMFTAAISINLGVLNFIPFPALDGGRILFVIIEAIIRRPIQPKIANAVNTVGFSLLILLMIVVTFKDVWNLFAK